MNGDPDLQQSFLIAIAEISRNSPLPIETGDIESLSKPASDDDSSESKKVNLVNLLQYLYPLFESSKHMTKQREQAIRCIGAICAGEKIAEVKKSVMKRLFNFANSTNDLDIHFAIGSALADCVPGVRSANPHKLWFVESEESEEQTRPTVEEMDTSENDGPPEEGTLDWLLVQLLNRTGGASPNKRQAMCLWLLTLVQDFKFRTEVQNKLEVIQGAFESYLDHTNPVVQDAASKGLCLVYDICSEETKKNMVDSLVKNLIEGL